MQQINTILSRMTLEQKAGTILITMLDEPHLEELLRRYYCGAFLVWGEVKGGHDPDHLCTLSNRVQQLSLEYRGLPAWLHGWIPGLGWRPQWQAEVVNRASLEEVEKAGAIFGSRWRAVGWHNLPIPTLNVHLYDTGIMMDWLISRDPDIVHRYGLAMTRGVLSARCGTMTQHFPAHGATPLDSHTAYPVVDLPFEELWQDHLACYQSCFDAGSTSLCTAHLACMALDPNPNHVATTSRKILIDFLRGRMGYRNLILADALEMQGFLKNGPLEEMAVQAVNAGCDSLCLCDIRNVEPVFSRVVRAVNEGEISMERLDEAVSQHLRFMDWLGLEGGQTVSSKEAMELINNDADNAFLKQIEG